jgi:hypothetical protein
MKIEQSKMKAMEKLFRKVRKNNGLTPDELNELAELSAHFLYIAKAAFYLKTK